MRKIVPPVLARLAALCLCIALTAAAASAQSATTTGDIEGRVLDPNGAVVPNASVTAKNKETGLEKTATTDDEGNYRIILLPPGTYTVRAPGVSGFQTTTFENVAVTVGGKTTLDINLAVGGTEAVVIDVSSEAALVETTRTSVSTTVDERSVENLPVSGRNYLDFATLTPGVVRDPTRVGDLSVGGQKGTLNNLQVDGADNNNSFFGQAFGRTGVRPPYQFSEESVKEFQVNQNGFSAEFGRAGGAVINVVTKSGTNEFHGGLFEYFRDESLNSNLPNVKAQLIPGTTTPRPNKRPPSQINQFGGRLGGPIVKDKAFFFVTYDGQRTNFLNVLEVPAIPASQQAFFFPRLTPYQIDRDQDVLMAKVDWAVDEYNQLSLRFNRQNFTGVNNEFTGAQAAGEHSGNSLAKTTTFTGALTSAFSPTLVNELRVQVARDSEPGTNNSNEPELQIRSSFGTLFFGRNNFSPRETTISRAQVLNNLSRVSGRHVMKVGVDAVFDRVLNFFPGSFGGIYSYNSINDFPNNPASFTQRFAGFGLGATTKPNTIDFGTYVQDDWRISPGLTLNLGVRYDYQQMARPPLQNPDPALLAAGLDTARAPADKDNIAPRAGFTYSPDPKSVVRGGYGIYYGRTTGIMLSTVHSGNGIQTTGITVNGAANILALTGGYPRVLAALPPGANTGRPDLFIFAEDYQQPYVQQGRLGYEREVFRNTSLSATYLFYKGVHLSRTRDVNLFAPESANAVFGSETFTVERFPAAGATAAARFTSTTPLRPFANYNRINLFEPTGNSRYDALAVQMNRRFSDNFQFLASYTLSRARDDKPDQTAVVPGGGDDAKIVQNQLNIRQDYSRSDLDIPHRFVFSPVYDVRAVKSGSAFLRGLLSHWTVSGIAQLQSGFAYSAVVNADLNRDGNSRNDRVPGTERNAFRTPNVYIFDMRVARAIPLGDSRRLRFILEGFNIFNRSNVATVNVNRFAGFAANGATQTITLTAPALSAPFGAARTFIASRELQLAVKFDF